MQWFLVEAVAVSAKKIELLAPGGDLESIKAAIVAGADAVYCGLGKFNARERAANISLEILFGVIRMAHRYRCRVFLTLNIVLLDSEFGSIIPILNRLVNTGLDGVIVQDIGLLYVLQRFFPSMAVHASTQATTHNAGQLRFLKDLGVERVNLSRELSLDEVRALTKTAHENKVAVEVFVHGSRCISFSGICLLGSALAGRSGNRGVCAQTCRDRFETTSVGFNYPINLKDHTAFQNVARLLDAGVDSLKIEGRIKGSVSAYTVVGHWRRQLDRVQDGAAPETDDAGLRQVFHRDFTDGFLDGRIGADMFIDNPMDFTATYRLQQKGLPLDSDNYKRERAILEQDHARLRQQLKDQVRGMTTERLTVVMRFSGAVRQPLRVSVEGKTLSFAIDSQMVLQPVPQRNGETGEPKDSNPLNLTMFRKRFKGLAGADYQIESYDLSALDEKLYIPFKELRHMRRRIDIMMNGGHALLPPVDLPSLAGAKPAKRTAKLAVVMDGTTDVPSFLTDVAHQAQELFYMLPDAVAHDFEALLTLLRTHSIIHPWFPSVLIGADFDAAVELLKELQPTRIVTDNSGIAHAASQLGVNWVAGPRMNITNSWTLAALSARSACVGAFVSNELNARQLGKLIVPEKFDTYYSMYHPLELMTSRQCLLHRVAGCNKEAMDRRCLTHCQRSARITHQRYGDLIIVKNPGQYHRLWHRHRFLNIAAPAALGHICTAFSVDMRTVPTDTQIEISHHELLSRFAQLVHEPSQGGDRLESVVRPTTQLQYDKGVNG